MSNDSVTNLKLTIGYVLFIEIIGYSKLLEERYAARGRIQSQD